MNVFLNENGTMYRRWVNVITSMLLPGSGHFLSGRKMAGAVWLGANLFTALLSIVLILALKQVMLIPAAFALLLQTAVWVLTAIDSCQKLIPRLKPINWVVVAAIMICMPLVLASNLRSLCFRVFTIPTKAMEPTLMGNRLDAEGHRISGDHILVERLSYHFGKPKRGDVAVFGTSAIPEGERDKFRIPAGEIYVKRVVGLPGERVSIQAHSIFINGQKLVEPENLQKIMNQTNEFQGIPVALLGSRTNVQLGFDEYYVLGDNLANSLDSRYYGAIKDGYFVGKAVWIYWPPERQGAVQ